MWGAGLTIIHACYHNMRLNHVMSFWPTKETTCRCSKACITLVSCYQASYQYYITLPYSTCIWFNTASNACIMLVPVTETLTLDPSRLQADSTYRNTKWGGCEVQVTGTSIMSALRCSIWLSCHGWSAISLRSGLLANCLQIQMPSVACFVHHVHWSTMYKFTPPRPCLLQYEYFSTLWWIKKIRRLTLK